MKQFFTLLLIASFGSAFGQCMVQAFGQPTGCGMPCTGNVQSFGNGTPPLAYVWQPGNYSTQNVSGLCAGTYTVTMTDGSGCIATALATVTQSNGPVASVQCSPAMCSSANGSAGVMVSGGTPPYSFFWTPTGQTTQMITGLTAGCYTVTVTDAGGCTTTGSCCVTVSNAPTITAMQQQPSNCPNCTGIAVSNASGGQMPYMYNWAPSGGNQATATGLCQGTYTVCVTDANGCTACTTVTIGCVTGLEDHSLETDVTLYPNPAGNELNITLDMDLGNVSMTVYNMLGDKIYAANGFFANGKGQKINVGNLSPGIYFLELRKENATIKKKFVKS